VSALPIGWLIFLGVYVVAAALGFYWVRVRLNRRAREIAATVESAGVKIVAARPTSSAWKPAMLELDGGAKLSVRQWGRNTQLITVSRPGPPMPFVLIRRERGIDRVAKGLGVEREVELGVAGLDAALFISSSAPPDAVRAALAGDEARRLVREIVDAGFAVGLSRDGVSATVMRTALAPFDARPLPGVIARLGQLAEVLPRSNALAAQAGGRPTSTLAVILPAFLLSFLAPMLLMAPAVRGMLHPPLGDGHVLRALGAGALAWVLVAALAARRLRTRPLALLEVPAVALSLLVLVPFVVACALFAANAGFDGSAATPHHARVVDYYKHNTHTVYVAPWDETGARQKVILPESLGPIAIGDAFDIDVRAGALGWPWVTSVRRAEK
jgi:hypothetical protein